MLLLLKYLLFELVPSCYSFMAWLLLALPVLNDSSGVSIFNGIFNGIYWLLRALSLLGFRGGNLLLGLLLFPLLMCGIVFTNEYTRLIYPFLLICKG